MNTIAQPPISSRQRPRVVVFGGGIGMFPPLMQRFTQDFDVAGVISPEMPKFWRGVFLALSVRWPKIAWYRRWRYMVEKTPFAFRCTTLEAHKALQAYEGQYDFILFMGAMYAPTLDLKKPMFIFTDSTRRLSSKNQHDEVSHFKSASDERRWLDLEGQVYRSATRIFVGSEFVRQSLINDYHVDARRAVTAGFGAGLGFGDPYEKRFDGRSILYIGKGDFEKKGGTLLLQAFELVKQEIPDAVLHVVGQEHLPEVSGMVNHGFVRDRNRIVELMRAAHVFALPSLVDRNPISILEAMAAATPCIASDYGAMPELVGDAGLIAPCNDVQALARALVTVLRDPVLSADLGQKGRRRFDTKYNWDSVWHTVRAEIWEGLDESRSPKNAPTDQIRQR
ncbi:glycosyltransferase family 4 protein [Aquabacterium sp.]|uniref:glycosyltransferase family 4 protein n=1 Tax=Aquabacterium sp. TaxID=1872578 RepID=UPI0035B4C465